MRSSFRLGALALVMGLFAAGVQAQSGSSAGSVTGSMPGSGSPGTAAGGGHLERIKASGTLRVCIWPDYYGISFRNPKNGELSGIDEVLSVQFARELGVKPVYIDTTFATFIDELLADRCDIAMFGVGITPARSALVKFSQPYLRSDIYAVTTKSHPALKTWDDIDKPGRVVAVQAGTFMEPVMKASLKQAELMAVKLPNTREREVQSGRADVFMTDYPYSRRVLDNADWARVIAPERPVSPVSYGYAVAPGDDAWLARIDKFVVDIKRDGRLLSAAKAFKLDPIVISP
jgi:ABC-type amino acid transport substrate-binding protein